VSAHLDNALRGHDLITCYVDMKRVNDLFRFSCVIITVFLVGYVNIYEERVQIYKIREGRGPCTEEDIKVR
jgi:hypothetical protein